MLKKCAAALAAGALVLLGATTAFADSYHLSDTYCVFDFSQVLDEEAVIHCNDYVKLTFNGHYGTDKENLRVWTSPIEAVVEALGDEDIDFYLFCALPKFAKDVKVSIDADEESFLYEITIDGELRRIDAEYEGDSWNFYTKKLGGYLVTEQEYPEGPLVK